MSVAREYLETGPVDECAHSDAEHFPEQPDRHDEPGSDEGFFCCDCGEWFTVDEATRRGL